jgi:hypothetical protein
MRPDEPTPQERKYIARSMLNCSQCSCKTWRNLAMSLSEGARGKGTITIIKSETSQETDSSEITLETDSSEIIQETDSSERTPETADTETILMTGIEPILAIGIELIPATETELIPVTGTGMTVRITEMTQGTGGSLEKMAPGILTDQETEIQGPASFLEIGTELLIGETSQETGLTRPGELSIKKKFLPNNSQK